MKISEALLLDARPFSRETFEALDIPASLYERVVSAFDRANASPTEVRRYRETRFDCDACYVTGLGADGKKYDWCDLIKEMA